MSLYCLAWETKWVKLRRIARETMKVYKYWEGAHKEEDG